MSNAFWSAHLIDRLTYEIDYSQIVFSLSLRRTIRNSAAEISTVNVEYYRGIFDVRQHVRNGVARIIMIRSYRCSIARRKYFQNRQRDRSITFVNELFRAVLKHRRVDVSTQFQ